MSRQRSGSYGSSSKLDEAGMPAVGVGIWVWMSVLKEARHTTNRTPYVPTCQAESKEEEARTAEFGPEQQTGLSHSPLRLKNSLL